MAKTVNDIYAIILGAVLLIVGVLGLFTTSILGIFSVNILQSILHIIAGSLIYFGNKGGGKKANQILGIIALIVGLLWFVVPGLLTAIFNINANISYLHLVIGVVSLAIGYGLKE